ncbi:hypothetical protein BDB01DRAFT_769875 [Pilobolus umbonatus]|nr:hypothetical protein BDB01DRAFT_769875 [Pilobolus umbonatus]
MSLPSPPPSPLDRRRHRRSDSFTLLQAILKENERLQKEQEEKHEPKEMIQTKLLRYSSSPLTKISEHKEIVIPHKSRSHHSVRFTTEPPKVFHYT